jgi:hypothetical protein
LPNLAALNFVLHVALDGGILDQRDLAVHLGGGGATELDILRGSEEIEPRADPRLRRSDSRKQE